MDDLTIALAAIKTASRGWYIHNYAGRNPKTIACREPTETALWYMTVRSWNFAEIAGCSTESARKRLSKLAQSGLIVEKARNSGARSWSAMTPDAVRIGWEIINELRAEGLPFDDEWRGAGMPSIWPIPVQTKEPGAACNGPRGERQTSPEQGISNIMNVTSFSAIKKTTFFKVDLDPAETASALANYPDLGSATRAGLFSPASASATDTVAVDIKADGSSTIIVFSETTTFGNANNASS